MSRAELSVKAGLAHSAAAQLESGARIPALDTVEHLARALAVSPCWLAFAADAPADPPGDALLCAGLGARLRQVRADRGLSLRALAAEAEISPTTLTDIEQASRSPRLDTFERIAKVLQVAPCWLAFGLGPVDAPRRGRPPRAPATEQPNR